MQGIGSVPLWSFVPAVDFCDERFMFLPARADGAAVPQSLDVPNDTDEESDLERLQVREPGEPERRPATRRPAAGTVLNVLLVGAADICHVLRTMSRCWRRGRSVLAINFYIMEAQAPIVARHMLLLLSLLDGRDEVRTEELARRYLEIYANCFLREKTYDFVRDRAAELVCVVTGSYPSHPITSLFDLSALRHRERDDLEFVFNFWRDESKRFDMEYLRDRRLLQFYDMRYDSRHNVADYDFHMKLYDKASIIHKREFVKWRLTGIAHEVRDANYAKTNRTMATVMGLREAGVKVPKWGFFSDVSVGPFYAYGIDTDKKELLRTSQDTHLHSSQEVAEFNVASYIHELRTASPYKEDVPKKEIAHSEEEKINLPEVTHPASASRIHVLPFDPAVTFQKRRRRYEGMFDCVYLSSSMAHQIGEVAGLLRKSPSTPGMAGGTLVVENVKYIVDFTHDVAHAYANKVREMCDRAGLVAEDRGADTATDQDHMIFRIRGPNDA